MIFNWLCNKHYFSLVSPVFIQCIGYLLCVTVCVSFWVLYSFGIVQDGKSIVHLGERGMEGGLLCFRGGGWRVEGGLCRISSKLYLLSECNE